MVTLATRGLARAAQTEMSPVRNRAETDNNGRALYHAANAPPTQVVRPMSILLEQVSKEYGDAPAVNDVTVNIADGELFVLLGPSGSGKSTLLRAIAGLTTIDHGRIVAARARRDERRREGARGRLRVSELRAVPPHDRGGQHRVRAARAPSAWRRAAQAARRAAEARLARRLWTNGCRASCRAANNSASRSHERSRTAPRAVARRAVRRARRENS